MLISTAISSSKRGSARINSDRRYRLTRMQCLALISVVCLACFGCSQAREASESPAGGCLPCHQTSMLLHRFEWTRLGYVFSQALGHLRHSKLRPVRWAQLRRPLAMRRQGCRLLSQRFHMFSSECVLLAVHPRHRLACSHLTFTLTHT